MESHVHRSIRARAEQLPEVTSRRFTASSGASRTWYLHEPCDDGCTFHGENEGFMQCKFDSDQIDSPFVLECQGCGYTVDYNE